MSSDSNGENGERADIERHSENLDSDEVLWTCRVDEVTFNTKVVLPEDATQDEALEEARERLVAAIRSGEADIRWKKSVDTKNDLESEEAFADMIACERCQHPVSGNLNEIDIEESGEFYEVDFDHEHERYVYVCDSCKEEMWDAAHADSMSE